MVSDCAWRCCQIWLRSSRRSGSDAGALFGVRDLLRHRLVLAVLLDERLDFRKGLGLLAVLIRVALHGGGAERRHQLFVLALNGD